MKAQVVVTLKHGVLDPAGKAVESSLHQLGFDGVKEVRLGKYIEVTLDDGAEPEMARTRLEQMCQQLLANTVIEDFRVELDS